MDSIMLRTSVRDFTDEAVSEGDLEKVLTAAMQAPSARNQQPWEFIVVDDLETIQSLSRTSPYGGPVSKAPMAVVFLGDESRMTVPMMWEQDMGACVENFMVAATSMGLGTVWIGIAPLQDRMDAISDLLSVPEGFKPFCIVAIGHPKEPLAPKPVRYDPVRIHRNSF